MQGERFFGTQGVSESHHRGPMQIIRNDGNKWDAGTTDPLDTAVANKVKAFVDGIKAGRFDNQAEQGAESTLSVILGRTAAYRNREVTWDEIVNSNEKWSAADLKLRW